ncbi:MAG: transglutaminase-like domain-containing protein [Candidatus Eisenbacteria bacterium]
MTKEETDFYSAPGPFTNPGRHAGLIRELPQELAPLVRAIQGCNLHAWWAKAYEVELTEERKAELQIRPIEERIDRLLALDSRPLVQTRPAGRRLFGTCRDFTLFLCSVLRSRGIPARCRCGFATYFEVDRFEDHWLCEVWMPEEGRWRLVDAQIDSLMRSRLGLDFDTLDVPRDRFFCGGEAWQLCRSRRVDPARFGIFDMHGLGFVRGDLVRDLLALNSVEVLPWDCWGIVAKKDEDVDAADLALLDQIAEVTSIAHHVEGTPDIFERLRGFLLEHPELRAPADLIRVA